MAARAVFISALLPFAFAFSDTVPVVAWSSYSSRNLDSLPSRAPHSTSLFESILSNDDVCTHDAVVLVDQPGLRASDLRLLDPSSHIAMALSSASSSRQFPYVRRTTDAPLVDFADAIAKRCGSRSVNFTPGQGGISMESSSKHVLAMNAPPLAEGSADSRMDAMGDHALLIASELKNVASLFPNHLVIISGSFSPFAKRQLPSTLDSGSAFSGALAPNGTNPSLAKGGILAHYQLLTPALITTLLVIFFVLVPIVLLGVQALSSIQSPLRVEAPKGYSAQDKKMQ